MVEQAESVKAALMDVFHIALVARIADGAEPLLEHELGEAKDRVQWRAHFVADLGEEIEPPRYRDCVGLGCDWVGLRSGGFSVGIELWLGAPRIDEAEQLDVVLRRERPYLAADLEAPA